MNRRTVLEGIGGAVGVSLTGCLSRGRGATGTDSPKDGETDTPADGGDTATPGTTNGGGNTTTAAGSLRVVKTTAGGLTPEPRAQSIEVTPDGRLRYAYDCNTRDGVEQTATKNLSPDEYADFESIVREADVFELRDRYECQKRCPTDLPSDTILFSVDGREKSVSIRPGAEVPPGLRRIRKRLGAFESRFGEFGCTSPDGTPTGEAVSVALQEPIDGGERSISVTAEGTVRGRVNCGDGGHENSTELAASEHARFERAVLGADPFTLSEAVGCEDCPERALTYTITVDDRQTEFRVPREATDSGRLYTVQRLIDRFRERLDLPDCRGEMSVALTIGSGGFASRAPVSLTVRDGEILMTKDCAPREEETWSASDRLGDEERAAFERVVRSADVFELPDEYGEGAMTDVPRVGLTVVVDDRRKEIDLTQVAHHDGPWGDWPEGLASIGRLLDDYRRRLDPPGCEGGTGDD